MGTKEVRFSDLSGELVPNPEELASITVVSHPDVEDTPVRLEARPEEISELGRLGIKAVMLDLQLPGEEEPTRHVMTAANFSKLATGRPMVEVLADAERVVAKRRGNGTSGEVRNHEAIEWAGTPHKGKTSPIEAQLVRENLEVVNERLAAQGYRTIDPANPEHARRYGFAAHTEG